MELIVHKTELNYRKIDATQAFGMLLLGILILLDYVLTYLGMYKFYMIDEGNPAMVWLMELPFSQGFIVRLLFVLIIEALLYVVMRSTKVSLYKDTKNNKYVSKYSKINYGNILLISFLILNLFIFSMHLKWFLGFYYYIFDNPITWSNIFSAIIEDLSYSSSF